MPRPVVIVDPSFRGQLHRLREERGWSYRDLGRAANYSHTLLWEVETGRKRPTRAMAARLDDVLCSGGVLSRLLTVPTLTGSLTFDDDARLAYLARHPGRVDHEAVRILSVMLADQRVREDTIGSTPLIAPVTDTVGQLTEVVRETSGPKRRQIVDLAAQWAQFAGWLNISVGRPAVAESWLDRAVVWAIEANNSDMASTALSFKGHLAWTLGDVGPMVSLTGAAQQFTGVYPGEMAYDALQAARGHAVAGDRAEVESQVARSRDLEALAQESRGDIPPWHYYRGSAFFALERGRVLRHLAVQGVDGCARRAVDELTAGLAALPPGPAHAARYLCDLAVAHALDGDLQQARAVLDDVDRIATATESTQLTAAVRRLRRQFG
jgi:transcriptional regulator with XRE-family HTH domain